jgi:AcrR family transcriptional regulator
MSSNDSHRAEPHRERAERILDAAAELMLRLGYRRATVEDVAEAAEIGKGTVYLHWKSRQALFLDVLRREAVASVDELVAAVRADPETVRLHVLARVRYSGLLKRPLLRAVHTGDSEVLGKLAKDSAILREAGQRAAFEAYLRLLSENGLLYGSFDVRAIAAAYRGVFHGFLTMGPSSGGEPATLLAATLRRAFEPTSPMPVLPAVAAEAARLLAESADADRAVLRRAYQ